jgi:hypothetical protein
MYLYHFRFPIIIEKEGCTLSWFPFRVVSKVYDSYRRVGVFLELD